MRVTVAEWEFGDDGLEFALGDVVKMFLTVEVLPGTPSQTVDDHATSRLVGTVRPVEHGWDTDPSIMVTTDGAELYCRDPEIGHGLVEIDGRVSRDHVDPPEVLRRTRLRIERIWMSYEEYVHTGDGNWQRSGVRICHAEVDRTHLVADPRFATVAEPVVIEGRRRRLSLRRTKKSRTYKAFVPAPVPEVGTTVELWSAAVLETTVIPRRLR